MKFVRLLVIPLVFSNALLLAEGKRETTTIPPGETQKKDLTTVNQEVVIAGNLEGTLILVSGELRLSGSISQDIIGFFSDVRIEPGAVIKRDLIMIGGSLTRADGAEIGGTLSHVRSYRDIRNMVSTVLPFLPDSTDMVLFRVVKIIFWFIICLGILALFPDRIADVSNRLTFFSTATVKIGLKGLGIYFLFLASFALFLFLSLFLIGIPLLLSAMLLFFITQAFGRTVLFFNWGKSLAAKLHLAKPGTGFFIVLGVIPYFVLKFLPILGFILLILMDGIAVGISFRLFFRKRHPTG